MPNLRIDAVKCCKSVGQTVGDEWREKLMAKLKERAEDEDPDVTFFAKEAIAAITEAS